MKSFPILISLILIVTGCKTNIAIEDIIDFNEPFHVSVAIKDCDSDLNQIATYNIDPETDKWYQLFDFAIKNLDDWSPSAAIHGDIHLQQGTFELMHNAETREVVISYVNESKKRYYYSKKTDTGELDFLVEDFKMAPVTIYGIKYNRNDETILINNIDKYLMYFGRRLSKESDAEILKTKSPYQFEYIYWNFNKEKACWIEVYPNQDSQGRYYDENYKDYNWILYTKINELSPHYSRNETECFLKNLLRSSGFENVIIKEYR
jgi:hypothetical protein